MDGLTNGASDGWSGSSPLESIRGALDANLNPRIPNQIRRKGLHFLEQVKFQAHAPQIGFTLADDWHQADYVRYYGLQLLEYAVRWRWSEYGVAQQAQLKTWITCLAGSLREVDQLFVRNKVAQLWVEVAKRCWGASGDGGETAWMDMDSQLVSLWEKDLEEKGLVNKIFVLYVLETLSEEIINSEDAVAGLRMDVLGPALSEVMIPDSLYDEHTKTRGRRQEVRAQGPGWVARVCDFFSECVNAVRMGGSPELSNCAVKALNALRPTMQWVSMKAALDVNCVDCLYLPFLTDDVSLQSAATETLFAIMSRPFSAHSQVFWTAIHQQALRPDHVTLLRQAFERADSPPGLDDVKYALQKKLAEVLSLLADAIAQHPALLGASKLDVPSFCDLLIVVLQSKSLVVSIPVLHSWSKLMAVQDSTIFGMVLQALGALLQTCSERLLRHESLPTDTDDADEVVRWLDEDFDTAPERHAFLGNYRRYCKAIIQAIARMRPIEVLQHVLQQMWELLQHGPYTGARGFNSERYSKNALSVLKFDAQFTVVSSALKGYSLWCQDITAIPQEDPLHTKAEDDRSSTEQALQEWCYSVMSVHVDDPEVAAEVLSTLVTILQTVKAKPKFVLQVVQHLLTMALYDNSAHQTFSDAVKSFESLRVMELQKLALAFANELLEVYHELEPRIAVLAEKHGDDARLVWGYKAFLFLIIHRASGIDSEMRIARLQQMLKPLYEAWQDPALSASVHSLQSFCETLGLGELPEFYKQYRFDQNQDWSAQQLDEAGQARRQRIKEGNDRIPLKMTRSLLAATIEELVPASDEYDTAWALWSGIIPAVLPNLLQMLRHAHAFHNMANWSHLPEELQVVVKRTLQDRFWQSGISNESKGEFYARISDSKSSYEGFASVVRGTMRNVREQGYQIVDCMTRFDELFYGLPDLAEPLAGALFGDAEHLSANHLHSVIYLATRLVTKCPPQRRGTFLPPLMMKLFTTLDRKISSEWSAIAAATEQANNEDDALADEMRVESVLRQLTYSMVSFVPLLLEYDRIEPPLQNGTAANGVHSPAMPTLSELVLNNPMVLEPLILFCTHALRLRDTRCCTIICNSFRRLVPSFQSNDAHAPQVREFICTEVLKACITSLNEPYFADMQKDLASLIAQIISLYGQHTSTPRDVLLSLPDMPSLKVEKAFEKIGKAGSERQQRALVLELLEGVRGVSISEAGKIAREMPKSKGRGGLQQQYMEVEQRPAIANGDEAGLECVAALFVAA